MPVTRRGFLGAGAAGAAGVLALGRSGLTRGAGAGASFKVGVTDWNLGLEARPEALALARTIGFEGVQVSIGKGEEALPLADPARQKLYLDEARRLDLPIASLCLEVLHRNILKSDPLGPRWVADSISIAAAMGVRVVLLPFFGNGALETGAEVDYVGDLLREIAPAAEKAGVVLGLEDTVSARDNARIMERTKSPAVLTYYDVGNSTRGGFNVVEEIVWLGRARICEVHLKDNPHFLGEGSIDFRSVVDALAHIGYAEWAHLETDCPTKSVEADMARNLAFVRSLMRAPNPGYS